MKRRGNQYDWSIGSRCGCAHENERWVTRFTVIHGSFDCVEPLTDVIHQVGSGETLGYLGAVHVWSTSVESRPSVSEVRRGISWVPAVTSGVVGDRSRSARGGRPLTVRSGRESASVRKSRLGQCHAQVLNAG